MDASNTTVVKPDGSAAGMALAGLVAAGVSLVILPVTLVVIVIVRSQEALPRLVQVVARRMPKRGLR